MQGLETTVSVGKQVSVADPSTLARQSLQVYSITGGQTESATDDDILGGTTHNALDPVEPGPGLDDHRVTVKVPLCGAQFGFWMAAFFGAETASGAPSDYTHTWNTGGAFPYVFIEHRLKTGRFRRHFACVGESLEIDLDAEREGFGMATISFIGRKETSATAVLTGTVTAAPTLDRPAQKLVTGIYNAVSGGDLMGGKFSYKRSLKRLRSADGTGVPYDVVVDGISTLTGGIRTRYNDDTHYDDAAAATKRALNLHLLRTSVRGIKFNMANMRLDRQGMDIEGPAGVEQNWNFRAWQDATNPALQVQVLNGNATLVLP